MSPRKNPPNFDGLPRYRVIAELSRARLLKEISYLKKQGWKPLGEPSIAVGSEPHAPPYFVQTMYREKGLPKEKRP